MHSTLPSHDGVPAGPGNSPVVSRWQLAGSAGPPLHPARVLLVEDGRSNQVVATRVLERLGHQVTLAENGREALAAMRRESFAAVLMDVQMPVMDGLEATRCIRRREREWGGYTPIIALTANTEPGDREACLEAGMDDYLAKPVQVGELQLALERAGAGSAA